MADFRYELPEEKIAQYPVEKRETSKLLLYNKGKISQDIFRNIPAYIPEGSLLVFNNTRVIRARLLFRKETGAEIEIFCLEPLYPADYEKSFGSTGPVEWKCIIGNLKKWKSRTIETSFREDGKEYTLTAEKISSEGEAWRIRFTWDRKNMTFSEIIDAAGHIPLPPYVKRMDEAEDSTRYQTVYSRIKGSVAAPTAGLHFTDEVLSSINNKGINIAELTLHIGAGTFKPVKSDDISGHEMHCEHFFIDRELLLKINSFRGNVIAVGTTSVRTLESLYWLGARLRVNPETTDMNIGQWSPYHVDGRITLEVSIQALLRRMDSSGSEILHGSTNIMIVPGYKFRIVNGMVTNFHQPGSTLLLLIAAYTGNNWKEIYNYALSNDFRFLSFGDSSLLLA